MSATMAVNWIKNLDHSDFCLQSWRNSPDAVADWLRDLDHADAGVRATAARMLGSMGATAQPAVSRLTDLLHDGDRSVRSAAAHALEQIKATPSPWREKTYLQDALPFLAGVVVVLGMVLAVGLLLR
jgi:HEAT repeat protein